MKLVLQRVRKASVVVSDQTVSSIGAGLLALVGIHREDTDEDMQWAVRKVLNTRIFEGDDGKNFQLSVVDKGLEILSVSQFTLFGYLKGNKLDFHTAMPPAEAREFYTRFLGQLREKYTASRVQDGVFGEMMAVDLVNDGPVTITLDSRTK